MMIPPHWNFPEPQSRSLREQKQLHVKAKSDDFRGFDNWSTCFHSKRFEAALCVQKGRPVATRTSKLKTRPPCSRRHGCRFPISLRFSAREPKAISTSPRAIGSTIFGSSSIGVERSASKKTAIGFVALNNPLLTAAPFPRFGKFSSNRIATDDGTAATLRITSPVESVEPSLITINSLPGLTFSR